MNWKITAKKWFWITVWTGLAGAASFFATHVAEIGLPDWSQPVMQVILTGIIVAAGNAVKHWGDPKTPAVPEELPTPLTGGGA